MTEIYKKIENFDNYYISNHGNVKNIETGKILKNRPDTHNYFRVNLCKNGKAKNYSINRLVALAFIDNPLNKKCVDHINNDPQNNHVSNLRWATNSENQKNKKVQSNNKLNVKGCSYDVKRKKFRARIVIDGIDIHLGYFNTLEEAKSARIKKAKEIFGEFTHSSEKLV
jgi:hypothetical protein